MKKANGAQSTEQTGIRRLLCHHQEEEGRGQMESGDKCPRAEVAWRGPLPLGEGCSFPSGGTVHLNGLPRAEQGALAFSPLDLLASLLPFVSPPITWAEVHEMLALAPGTQQPSLKSRDGASRAVLPAESHLESNLPMFKKTLKHALPL